MLKLKPGTETFRWTIWRGMAWSQVVQVLDDAGAPRDLTGASARLLLGPSWRDDPVLEATIGTGITVLDAAQGVLELLLSPIQTLALAAGVAVLDLAVMAADGVKLLHLRAAGKVLQTLDAQLSDGAVPPTPDAFAGLVEGRPLLTDAISETEVLLVSDPARVPDRLGRRSLKPILDAKLPTTLPAGTYGPGSPEMSTIAAVRPLWSPVAVDTMLTSLSERIVALAGCSTIAIPSPAALYDQYWCAVLNLTGDALTIAGDDDSLSIDDGQIATIIQVADRQLVLVSQTTTVAGGPS